MFDPGHRKHIFKWFPEGQFPKQRLEKLLIFLTLTIGKSFLDDFLKAQFSPKKAWETSEIFVSNFRTGNHGFVVLLGVPNPRSIAEFYNCFEGFRYNWLGPIWGRAFCSFAWDYWLTDTVQIKSILILFVSESNTNRTRWDFPFIRTVFF